MSQNPATSHRRTLAPPAVTRFQLRTACASEAVFAPPFVARHPVSMRYAALRPAAVSHARAPARERVHYSAPRSIHAPEHDSWPVAAPDGAAGPAWSQASADFADEPSGSDGPLLELTDAMDAHELELFDVVNKQDGEHPTAAPHEPYIERADTPRDPAFPLDAFIVPASVAQLPAGYADNRAAQLADRLEELGRQIRERGISAIGTADHPDQLARVLGAIMAGYLARDA